MRVSDFVVAAALAAGLSSPALAQTSTPSTPTTPTQPAPLPPQPQSHWYGTTESPWTAAGFVGTRFHPGFGLNGQDLFNSNETSIEVGGQVPYLYKGLVGGE